MGKTVYMGFSRRSILDYHIRKIPLFVCDKILNKNKVKKKSLGYTLVGLNRLGHKDDSFILGSQAHNCFMLNTKMIK